MSIEKFKQQISTEIEAVSDNSPANRKTHHQLILLQKAASLEELMFALTEMQHPNHVRICANSPAVHELILENPDLFIAFFSRDNIKAIIHQAAKLGNLALVICLIDKIKLNVLVEKVASPNASYTNNGDGTYAFHDSVPFCHAAAKSGKFELMHYALSFYDLNSVDKTSVFGELQIALTHAAEQDSYDAVKLLLTSGINANSVREKDHSTTALYYAVLYGSMQLIKLLVDSGANISSLNKFHAVRNGRVDIVEYFVSKAVDFKESNHIDPYWRTAFESGSVDMARYFLETLKIDFYEPNLTAKRKQYIDTSIIKKVAQSGSIEMLNYIENELKLPVIELIQKEMDSTKQYHHTLGDFILIDIVCSYNVQFLKFIFEKKGLMPKKQHLEQLLGYAYDNGRGLPQHLKFVTHAYVYSLLHKRPQMRELLLNVSNSTDLSNLSNPELFRLYADYTENFQVQKDRFAFGVLFRDNSIHLSNEIAKRKFTNEDFLGLASINKEISADVLYFLVVSGNGYAHEDVINLIQAPIFDMHGNVEKCNRLLHLALHYRRTPLVEALELALDESVRENASSRRTSFLPGLTRCCSRLYSLFHRAEREPVDDKAVPAQAAVASSEKRAASPLVAHSIYSSETSNQGAAHSTSETKLSFS